jgi:desulfoferrodoxin-like iron-binding protein
MSEIYKCELCGKMVKVYHEGRGELVCCGQPMKSLPPGFNSIDEILKFAISKEEESRQFYTDWARRMEDPSTRQLFEDLACEELKHKTNLQEIKQGDLEKLLGSLSDKVMDLKISDYLVDISPKRDLDYQEALILAMKKEKASFKLYADLAATTQEGNLHRTFLALAQEEARHKLRLEIEYDEHILTED